MIALAAIVNPGYPGKGPATNGTLAWNSAWIYKLYIDDEAIELSLHLSNVRNKPIAIYSILSYYDLKALYDYTWQAEQSAFPCHIYSLTFAHIFSMLAQLVQHFRPIIEYSHHYFMAFFGAPSRTNSAIYSGQRRDYASVKTLGHVTAMLWRSWDIHVNGADDPEIIGQINDFYFA